MIPIYQTKFSSNTDPNQHGSCLRACLASLFEIKENDIPIFEDMGHKWAARMFQWLKTQKAEYFGCGKSNNVELYNIGIDGYYIVTGPSPRFNCSHAVICYKGKFIHDPHPEGVGLNNIENYFMIERLRNY